MVANMMWVTSHRGLCRPFGAWNEERWRLSPGLRHGAKFLRPLRGLDVGRGGGFPRAYATGLSSDARFAGLVGHLERVVASTYGTTWKRTVYDGDGEPLAWMSTRYSPGSQGVLLRMVKPE